MKINNLRKLNEHEVEVLNVALETLLNTSPSGSFMAVSAKAVLDQKMPEHFFWATYERD